MKPAAIVITLVLAGAGAGVVWLRGPTAGVSEEGPSEALFAVQRGDFNITLTENGTLMARESQEITPSTESSGRITFLIEEGKAVEQGEVLCRLDTTQIEEQIAELQLSISTAEVAVHTARTELQIQQGDNESAIEKADIALEKARKELERYKDGDAPAERRKLNVAISEAETNYSRSKKKYEDSQKLFEQEYVNRSQLEQDQIEFERDGVRLEGSRIDLQMFDKYTLPMTTAERESAVRDAERERTNAAMRAEASLRQKEVALQESEKRLEMQQKELGKQQEELKKYTIIAPAPGIVLYGDPEQEWRREEIRIGSEIWGGNVLFTLPDLRVMQVKLQVHEADVNKLAVGQAAKVTMDTYPDIVLDGEVSKVAAIAASNDDWRRDSEVKKFDVSVTLKHAPELQLKPGISAKAEIFMETRADVLYVPLQCVFQEEGVHFSYVQRALGPERVVVQPGGNNDTYVEILSGLSEGDQVLLYNPDLPAAVQKTEEEGAEGDAPSSRHVRP